MQIRYKKIPVKTQYLQTKNMPCNKVSWQNGLYISKKNEIEITEYRRIYSKIGKAYGWSGHSRLSDKRLKEILNSPELTIYYLYDNQKIAGLIELKEKTKSIELLYFGLVPDYIAKGLGKKLMQTAFYLASNFKQTILELHTCEFDHPNALSFYLSLGFKISKEQIDCEFYALEFIKKNKIMTVNKKLEILRQSMKKENIEAYIINISDPHLSEYVPARWRTIEWLSGFTGSAGRIVVTPDFAGLWTDSRYFIQAEAELSDSDFQLMKLKVPHAPEYIDWLVKNIKTYKNVAIFGKLVAYEEGNLLYNRLNTKNSQVRFDLDLINLLWKDRPSFPLNKIYLLDEKYSGKSSEKKIQELKDIMKQKNLDYFLVSALDEIAWLFNIRSNDIEYSPVAIAYALISNRKTILFIKKEKLNAETESYFKKLNVQITNYEDIEIELPKINKGANLGLSPTSTNLYLTQIIPKDTNIKEVISPIAELKACKNEIEIANMLKAHIKDAVALTKFFYWLEQIAAQEKETEFTLGQKLHLFRAEQENYVEDSFEAIVGFNAKGAIVHYTAQKDSASKISPNGILLVDSGGQYYEGTTDITRTIALGNFPETAKDDFTLVLKGHLQLAMAEFPEGTAGYQLDSLARMPLWQNGKDYGHGTGHGVGCFLNVHEGPQAIRSQSYANYPLKEGMIISNEPGYYPEGKYGIRIENLVLCKKATSKNFLKFETISLFPIDIKLINKSLLSKKEIDYLNKYHKKVYQTISPLINDKEKNWLKEKTQAL